MSFSKLATLDLSFLYSDPENGSIKIPSKLNEYDLPESCYLLIGTPIKVDGDALGEPQVKQRLNRFEATFTVNFGKNALHKKVFEAVIRPNKDEYSFVSNIVRTPSKHDGPNINKRTWDNFHEILRALEALKDSTLKSKIHRALECHQQALSCPDGENDSKFFFYWTAITVLSGQGTLRTNEKIQKIYDVSKEHVEKVFLWKNIVTVRNNYFKEGKKVNFNQDEERYLQLIFLDLLRHQLQLTPLNAIEYGICNLDLSGFQ